MKRYFKISTIIALLLLLIGGLGFIANGGVNEFINYYSDSSIGSHDFSVKENYSFDTLDDITFDIDVKNTDINITEGTSDKIEITVSEKSIFDLNNSGTTVSEDNGLISIKNDPSINYSFFSFGGTTTILDIQVPSEVYSDAKIKTQNGYLNISNQNFKSLSARTTNAFINFDNSSVDGDLSLSTTNAYLTLNNLNVSGDVIASTTNAILRISNTSALNLDAETTNGKYYIDSIDVQGRVKTSTTNATQQLSNINAKSLEAKTTNGKLECSNIYAEDVSLRTTNGNISLDNEDKSYIINYLRTSTTNGTERINALYEYWD